MKKVTVDEASAAAQFLAKTKEWESLMLFLDQQFVEPINFPMSVDDGHKMAMAMCFNEGQVKVVKTLENLVKKDLNYDRRTD